MLTFKQTLSAEIGDLPYIVEGGNIWKGDLETIRINRQDVLPTVQWLEKLTGLPLVDSMLGSTGRKASSGDIDLAVDSTKHDKDQLVAQLKAWAAKNDPSALVKKSGVNVHFRTPINGNPANGYVQTDFMFMPDTQFAKWAMTSTSEKFKGAHRTIIIASIAKSLGLRYSFLNGLTSRTTDKPIQGGKDPEYIAKILLGPNATAANLETPEAILAALANDPDRDVKLADARETLGKEGIQI